MIRRCLLVLCLVALFGPVLQPIALAPAAAQPADSPQRAELGPEFMHTVSCLGGNGRVDTNIVNTGPSSARYRVEIEGLRPRARTVASGDWWRLPVTGRPDRQLGVVITRDGALISERTLTVSCDSAPPEISDAEVQVVNSCRGGNGYVLFQFANPTASSRAYVIEFDGVRNRSTTARAYGQAVRAVTGRPDGDYDVTIKVGGQPVATRVVSVRCDEPIAAPLAPGVVSDDFTSTTLGTAWEFHRPTEREERPANEQPSLELSGSHAVISVPEGHEHNLWVDANDAPRLRQTGPFIGDFGVEAKFDSILNRTFQMQGIVVEEDADTLLRFEVHYGNSGGGNAENRFFIASLDGAANEVIAQGSLPAATSHYVRVNRTGSTWEMGHSVDGAAWTSLGQFNSSIVAQHIGPYAGNIVVGNATVPPAFLGSIDHFFNLASPIRPEDAADTTPPTLADIDVTVNAAPAQSATVTWSTDEPSTTLIRRGFRSTYKEGAIHDVRATRNHSITLEPVNCGSTYHFAVESFDSVGNSAASEDHTFATNPCPAGGFTDNFDGDLLDPRWHVRDPLADGSVTVGGGLLRLSVPDVIHDMTPKQNTALRIMQPIDGSKDFQVTAGFESAVSAATQIQGLVFENSEHNLIRFDLFYDEAAAEVRAFVGERIKRGGTNLTQVANKSLAPHAAAPIRLRATHQQGSWKFETRSANQQSWTVIWEGELATRIARVGPYVGNAKSQELDVTPPNTALVDFFEVSTDLTPITAPSPSGGPDFTFHDGVGEWRGIGTPELRFGSPGMTQPDVNVRGNVSDPDGILSLTYTVNDQFTVAMGLGSTDCDEGISCTTRLAADGDFNADIDGALLQRGWNSVGFRALDTRGNVTTSAVQVEYLPSGPWPMPYEIDWSSTNDISTVSQIVDGTWTVDGAGGSSRLRTTEIGYDRIVALGDNTWSAYDVTVPIEIHSVDQENGAAPPSGGAAVGFVPHWRGHVPRQFEQPSAGVVDRLGGVAWYRFPKRASGNTTLQIRDFENKLATEENLRLEIGTPYVYKMRTHPTAVGSTEQIISMKIWPEGDAEPADWMLTTSFAGGPQSGSLLLVAHHVDASFGDVSVVPVPPGEWTGGGGNPEPPEGNCSAPSVGSGLGQFRLGRDRNVRVSPDLGCPAVAELPDGSVLDVSGPEIEQDGFLWRPVVSGGRSGWLAVSRSDGTGSVLSECTAGGCDTSDRTLGLVISEDPFECDGSLRTLATVSGFDASETVVVTVNGTDYERAASNGVRTISWRCSNDGSPLTLIARGASSSLSIGFTIATAGRAGPPPPQEPECGEVAWTRFPGGETISEVIVAPVLVATYRQAVEPFEDGCRGQLSGETYDQGELVLTEGFAGGYLKIVGGGFIRAVATGPLPPPSDVRGLTVRRLGAVPDGDSLTTTIKAEWESAPGATSYTARWTRTNGSVVLTKTTASPTQMVHLSGGLRACVEVRANNGRDGSSEFTPKQCIDLVQKLADPDVTEPERSGDSMIVSWDPVPNATEYSVVWINRWNTILEIQPPTSSTSAVLDLDGRDDRVCANVVADNPDLAFFISQVVQSCVTPLFSVQICEDTQFLGRTGTPVTEGIRACSPRLFEFLHNGFADELPHEAIEVYHPGAERIVTYWMWMGPDDVSEICDTDLAFCPGWDILAFTALTVAGFLPGAGEAIDLGFCLYDGANHAFYRASGKAAAYSCGALGAVGVPAAAGRLGRYTDGARALDELPSIGNDIPQSFVDDFAQAILRSCRSFGAATEVLMGDAWSLKHWAPAYDLTVANAHTHYVGVGDDHVLVHNQNCSGRQLIEGAIENLGDAGLASRFANIAGEFSDETLDLVAQRLDSGFGAHALVNALEGSARVGAVDKRVLLGLDFASLSWEQGEFELAVAMLDGGFSNLVRDTDPIGVEWLGRAAELPDGGDLSFDAVFDSLPTRLWEGQWDNGQIQQAISGKIQVKQVAMVADLQKAPSADLANRIRTYIAELQPRPQPAWVYDGRRFEYFPATP